MPSLTRHPNKTLPAFNGEWQIPRNFKIVSKVSQLYVSAQADFKGCAGVKNYPKAILLSALNGVQKGNAIGWLPIHRFEGQAASRSSSPRALMDSNGETSYQRSSENGYNSDRGGLLKSISIIGVATASSKILGLLRETILAAAFGIGPVTTSFNYASIIPGFFISLLGGINGPLHTTITTTLSKHSKDKGKQLLEKASSVIFLASAVFSITIFAFADSIIDLAAPGLLTSGNNGQLIRDMAIIQLKIMTPCMLFAGPIGVGFGCLNAVGIYDIPSLSPALSSGAIILAIVLYCSMFGSNAGASQMSLSGGIFLACGASIGALAQWLVQAIAQQKAGFNILRIGWTNYFVDTDMRKFFAVMLPATVGSGMLQIATFTDLYFASFIPGAAASISYANLLAMAPLGILSSSLLLPLLPILSQLSKPSLWPRLNECLKRAVLLCMVATLPLIAIILPLANPIVEVLFQRFAFDAYATAAVSSLLVCYILGSPFYLVRDLIIRVFYALDDGQTPFHISTAAVVMNAILDWLFISKMSLGSEGLVLATSFVNFLSVVTLLVLLSKKIGGLNFSKWTTPCLLLTALCIFSTITTALVHMGLCLMFSYTLSVRSYWISKLVSILLASGIGVLAFLLPLWWLQLQGFGLIKNINQTD